MKRFLLFILFSFPFLIFGQSTTKTSLIGTVTFSNFTTGGSSDVTGSLINFNDQTNQYFANQIQVGDVVWDNIGQRWEVMAVSNGTLTTVDVDLRAINGQGGTPMGSGYVNRETPNVGLSVFVPDNNIGISQQLKSRVESHNMMLVDSLLAAAASGPPIDNGNILYVDVGGDNSTAVKGDPSKPWADPWAAVTAADSFDLVYVRSGVYNWTGNTGTSLLKREVDIHFETVTFSGTPGTVFRTVPGENYDGEIRITGDFITPPGGLTFASDGTARDLDLFIEVQRLGYIRSSTDSPPDLFLKAAECFQGGNVIDFASGGSYNNALWIFDIGHYDGDVLLALGFEPDDFNIFLNCDYAYIRPNNTVGAIYAGSSSLGSINSNYASYFNEVIVETPADMIPLLGNNHNAEQNTTYSFWADKLHIKRGILFGAQNRWCNTCTYNVHANYVTKDTGATTGIFGPFIGNKPGDWEINISGHYEYESPVPLIDINATGFGRFNFNGTLYSTGDQPAIDINSGFLGEANINAQVIGPNGIVGAQYGNNIFVQGDSTVMGGQAIDISNFNTYIGFPDTSGTGGDNWGTQTVASDATINGDGTPGSPLSVSAGAGGDDWGAQVVQSDATLTGDGTAGSPLSVIGGGGGSFNTGDVLYVSVNGDNGTAVKGDPSLPWRDPWSAKDAAVSGDVVYVYPGTYSTGIVGSGADREDDGTNLEATSLMKDGVTYYLESDAIIETTASIHQPIFYDATGQVTHVYGSGTLIANNANSRIATLNHASTELVIEAAQIRDGVDGAAWGYGFYLDNYKKVHVTAHELYSRNSRTFSWNNTNVTDAVFVADIENFVVRDGDAPINLYRNAVFNNSSVSFNIGNADFIQNYTTISLSGAARDNTVFSVNIENGKFQGGSAVSSFSSNAVVSNNSQIKFHCGNCTSEPVPVFFGRKNTAATENLNIYITGNWHYTGGLEFFANNVGFSDGDVKVYIDANIVADSSNIYQWDGPMREVYMSGRWERRSGGPVIEMFNNNANRIEFRDLLLVNDGTTPAIETNTPQTIYVSDAFHISDGVDTITDVTFVRTNEYGAATGGGGADGNGIYDGSGSLSGATTVTVGPQYLTFDVSDIAAGVLFDGGASGAETFVNRDRIIMQDAPNQHWISSDGIGVYPDGLASNFVLEVTGNNGVNFTHDPGNTNSVFRRMRLNDTQYDFGNFDGATSATIDLGTVGDISLDATGAIKINGITYPSTSPSANQVLGEGAVDDDILEWVTVSSGGADGNGIYDGSGNMFANGTATLQTPTSNTFNFETTYNGTMGLNFGSGLFKNAEVEVGFYNNHGTLADVVFSGTYKATGSNVPVWETQYDDADGGDWGFLVNETAAVMRGNDGSFVLHSTNGNYFTDTRLAGSQAGIEYSADYSADYTNRSLVDKEYVDGLLGGGGNGIYGGSGSLSGNTTITGGGFNIDFDNTGTFEIDASQFQIRNSAGLIRFPTAEIPGDVVGEENLLVWTGTGSPGAATPGFLNPNDIVPTSSASKNWTTRSADTGANVVLNPGQAFIFDAAGSGGWTEDWDTSNLRDGDIIRVKFFGSTGADAITIDPVSGNVIHTSSSTALNTTIDCGDCDVEFIWSGSTLYVFE